MKPKYKNIFAKGQTQHWSEEVFVIKKIKLLYRGHMFILIIMEKKLVGIFLKNNCEKQIKQFRFEKVIKRRGEKLYVIWKGYDNFLTAG